MGKNNQIKIGGLYQSNHRLYVWSQPTDQAAVIDLIEVDDLFVILGWEKIPDAHVCVCCRILTKSSLIGYVDIAPEDLELVKTNDQTTV